MTLNIGGDAISLIDAVRVVRDRFEYSTTTDGTPVSTAALASGWAASERFDRSFQLGARISLTTLPAQEHRRCRGIKHVIKHPLVNATPHTQGAVRRRRIHGCVPISQ